MEQAAYQKRLSEESIGALQSFIGRPVVTLYSSWLGISGGLVAAHGLSLSFFDPIEYGVVRCEYFETPEYLVDYWQMRVSKERTPFDIEVNEAGALMHPCSIEVFPSSAISRIEVWEKRVGDGGDPEVEIVSFDQALRFHRDDGKQFQIFCHQNGPGWAGMLKYTESAEDMRKYSEDTLLRVEIT